MNVLLGVARHSPTGLHAGQPTLDLTFSTPSGATSLESEQIPYFCFFLWRGHNVSVLCCITMLEPEALRRAFGTFCPNNLEFRMERDRGLILIGPQWIRLCEESDMVQRELKLACTRLGVDGDMTKSFDALEREASAVMSFALRLFEPHDQMGPLPGPQSLWEPTLDNKSQSPNTFCTGGHGLACLMSLHGRWSIRMDELHADSVGGWIVFGNAVGILARGLDVLVRKGYARHSPRRCEGFGPGSSYKTPLSPVQLEGLRCAYTYSTMMLMAAAVGSPATVDDFASRLNVLWRRVRHLLETGEDDPSLATSPQP